MSRQGGVTECSGVCSGSSEKPPGPARACDWEWSGTEARIIGRDKGVSIKEKPPDTALGQESKTVVLMSLPSGNLSSWGLCQFLLRNVLMREASINWLLSCASIY